MTLFWILAAAMVVAAVALLAASQSLAATARVDIYPPDIKLNTRLASQRVIVVATRDDGVTEDVTAKAGSVFELSEVSRGLAFGDVDNDGDGEIDELELEMPPKRFTVEAAGPGP